MEELGSIYEIRYGWTSPGAWVALIFALLIGIGFIPGVEPPGDDHIELVFAPFLAVIVLVASCRRTAVLIGPKGITLGGLLFVRRAEFVAWSEIVSVSLHKELEGIGRLKDSQLEVRRKKGAAPPWEPADSPAMREIDEYLDTYVDADFVETFRGTTLSTPGMGLLCRVDPARLKEAVQAFAPEVRVFGDVC